VFERKWHQPSPRRSRTFAGRRWTTTPCCSTPTKLQAGPICDAREYPGVSVRLTAFLGEVRIPVQIDIGFSDVITPAAVEARGGKSFDMSNVVEQVLSKGD
jgi:hypothetical protein